MNPYTLLLLGAPHLVYFGWVKPYQTWRARNKWQVPPPPRIRHYQNTAAHLLACGCLSLVTMALLAWSSSRVFFITTIHVLDRPVAHPRDVWFGLLPREWPGPGDLALGAAAYAVLVAVELASARRALDRGDPHMHFTTPRTRPEVAGWVLISVLAGVTEELTWRAVQPELIAQLTGSLLPAVVVCAATFGIGHIQQGRQYAVIAGLFALVFHAVTLATGSLLVAMIVHAAINVTTGLRAGAWAKSAPQ